MVATEDTAGKDMITTTEDPESATTTEDTQDAQNTITKKMTTAKKTPVKKSTVKKATAEDLSDEEVSGLVFGEKGRFDSYIVRCGLYGKADRVAVHKPTTNVVLSDLIGMETAEFKVRRCGLSISVLYMILFYNEWSVVCLFMFR